MEIKKKSSWRILQKEKSLNCEILVFEHKDNPEAGLQVPGGTIEEDELVIDALIPRNRRRNRNKSRMILVLKGKVNKTNYYPENQKYSL